MLTHSTTTPLAESAEQAPPQQPDLHRELRATKPFSLARAPASDAAHALVERVAQDIQPLLGQRARAAQGGRDKGRERRLRETGYILAGLFKEEISNQWYAVSESPATWFWKKARNLPVKHNAFWTKMNAMRSLGLVEYVSGKRFHVAWLIYDGHPACVRPSQTLRDLATQLGCTSPDDWELVTPASIEPLKAVEHLKFTAIPRMIRGRIDEQSKTPIPVPTGCEDIQQFMKILTDCMAETEFTGCASPVFQARFIGVREFGGRVYAQGADNYQNGISKAERRKITINGEPVAEIDLAGSYLSIALALLNAPPPEGDPYALPGLSPAYRDAIKHWFILFWQKGKAPKTWPGETPQAIKAMIKPKDIKGPAFERYPALKDVTGILPAFLRDKLDPNMLEWAVGQYLTGVEAKIMRTAIRQFIEEGGGVALPMHDGLIVPQSWSGGAKSVVVDACITHLGREIRVEVKE